MDFWWTWSRFHTKPLEQPHSFPIGGLRMAPKFHNYCFFILAISGKKCPPSSIIPKSPQKSSCLDHVTTSNWIAIAGKEDRVQCSGYPDLRHIYQLWLLRVNDLNLNLKEFPPTIGSITTRIEKDGEQEETAWHESKVSFIKRISTDIQTYKLF